MSKLMAVTQLVMVALAFPAVISVTQRLYSSVSIEEGLLTACHLSTRVTTSRINCGLYCLREPECAIYCVSGDQCILYKALVSWFYVPEGPLKTKKCFSSWGAAKDAASYATITASSVADLANNEGMATIGYYCKGKQYCFASNNEPQPWWVANLGSPHTVTSVRVAVRDTRVTYFQNVEVRVGNNLAAFTANSLLGSYVGPAGKGEVITFNDTALTGSVVSLQRTDTVALHLCDVQILYA